MLPVLASLLVPAHAPAATATEAASYRSIELHGGGTVSVRYGPERRVTISPADHGREIRSQADRLVIERCRGECSQGHRIDIEVVTPQLAELAVSDGGTIRLIGDFPAQDAVAASVSDGGTIDMRSLEAERISASIAQGGRILAYPRRQLAASISDGGVVTYWGTADVRSSVRRGGTVLRGAAGELGAPLARFDTPLAPLPLLPLPPAPPATPKPPRAN